MLHGKCQQELIRVEALLKAVAAEKERQIQQLTEELKRVRGERDRYLQMILPIPKAPAPKLAPAVTAERGEGSWQQFLNNHMRQEDELVQKAKEQANGIPNQNRSDVHEPVSGTAARRDERQPAGTARETIT
jgi:hypothetical protein